jgi:hypothetical protein
VSNRLVGDFVTCLRRSIEQPAPPAGQEGGGEGELAAQPTAKPVRGFSLLLSVLWERIKRFFGRLLGRG